MAPPRSPGGLLRLVHPFPILLDGIATGAVALLAGGEAPTALRLGVAMVALQASIGALNDLVDAPLDAGRKPGKPIPAGLVSPGAAWVGHVGAAGLTSCSPFLPVRVSWQSPDWAWPSATATTSWRRGPPGRGCRSRSGSRCCPSSAGTAREASLPAFFAILLPAAVMAGAALAIANAQADMDRDQAAGLGSIAIRPRPARRLGGWSHLPRDRGLGRTRSVWLAGAPPLAIAASFGAAAVRRRRRHWAKCVGGGPGACLGSAGNRGLHSWERRGCGASALGVGRRGTIVTSTSGLSLRTIAIAFSSLSFAIVRYLARFARSVVGIEPRSSGLRRTATSVSTASASPCLALTSESSEMISVGRASVFDRPSRRHARLRVSPLSAHPDLRAVDRQGRARSPTFDLVAELDEGQLAAGHLCGARRRRFFGSSTFISSWRGRDCPSAKTKQARGSRGGARPIEAGSPGTPCPLPQLVGQFPGCQSCFADHPVEHRRLIEWRQVRAGGVR